MLHYSDGIKLDELGVSNLATRGGGQALKIQKTNGLAQQRKLVTVPFKLPC